jgi:hypothetical protein
MSIDTGGPAFPYQEVLPDGMANLTPQRGMTLRDYFAAKAMTGLVTGNRYKVGMSELPETKQYADKAYAIADAMLRARQ